MNKTFPYKLIEYKQHLADGTISSKYLLNVCIKDDWFLVQYLMLPNIKLLPLDDANVDTTSNIIFMEPSEIPYVVDAVKLYVSKLVLHVEVLINEGVLEL